MLLVFASSAQAQIRRGMTFTVLGQQGSYVHVGADGVTNAYNGDTSADQYLPLLCVNVDQQPAPTTIAFDFYNGWVRGTLAVTNPIQGTALTSQQRGDEICTQTFGFGYRMAEFHDGYYGPDFAYSGGWSYWGAGSIAGGTRFWTAIYDQPANPWNSAGTPQSMGEILSTINQSQLSELMRLHSDEELEAYLTPYANQIADYVLAKYGEDIRPDIAGNPQVAVALGCFYYGRENGVSDLTSGYRAQYANPGWDCFKAALSGVLGIREIGAIYADFAHGVSARTIIGALKSMGRRVFWGIAIGLAVWELGDCLDWW